MSLACREHELDALLAGELPPAEAERVRAHADACAACQHALSWLKLERGWMAQRARRPAARPNLDFSAVQARLAAASAPSPRSSRTAPQRVHWSHRAMAAMGAAAAVAFLVLGGRQPTSPANYAGEEPWSSQEVLVSGLPQACMDPSGEAVAATEDRFGACLIATPALPTY